MPAPGRRCRDVRTSGIYGSTVSERAKLFMTGGSQAVRLPRAYRFEKQDEVLISRRGEQVILEPTRRRWSRAFLELPQTAPDFPYPEEPPPAEPAPDLE